VFKNRENALKFAQKLNSEGYDVKTLFKKNRTVVFIGYFKTTEEARQLQKELKSKGIDSVLKRRR
jgi:cell division protein FtsN